MGKYMYHFFKNDHKFIWHNYQLSMLSLLHTCRYITLYMYQWLYKNVFQYITELIKDLKSIPGWFIRRHIILTRILIENLSKLVTKYKINYERNGEWYVLMHNSVPLFALSMHSVQDVIHLTILSSLIFLKISLQAFQVIKVEIVIFSLQIRC